MRIAASAHFKGSGSEGKPGPKEISTRVPTGNSISLAATAVVPSSCGVRTRRRLRVQILRHPFEAATAPATTRRPLPIAPRVGMRQSLDETNGRLMLKRCAISSGLPGRPGPVS
jgi:hypothetical protein